MGNNLFNLFRNSIQTGFDYLSQKEMMQVEGGAVGVTLFSFVLTEVLNGVKHNTECHLTL